MTLLYFIKTTPKDMNSQHQQTTTVSFWDIPLVSSKIIYFEPVF